MSDLLECTQVISKISGLYPNVWEFNNIVQRLTTKDAIIAGGSIVYGCDLTSVIPSDIDVFVLADESSASARTLELIKYVMRELEWFEPSICLQFEHAQNEVAVVSVVFGKLSNLVFQFISTKHTDPMEVLKHFDFDYVQCGIYGGKLLTTAACARAHRDKKVSMIYAKDFKDQRVTKVLNKGFSMPYISNSTPHPREQAPNKPLRLYSYEEFCSQFTISHFSDNYSSREYLNKPIDLNAINVVAIEPHVEGRREYGKPNKMKKLPYQWVFAGSPIKRRFVSIELEIEFVEFHRVEDSGLIIGTAESSTLRKLGFESAGLKLSNRFDLKKSQRYIAIVELYHLSGMGRTPRHHPTLSIVALYEPNATNITPVAIDGVELIKSLCKTFTAWSVNVYNTVEHAIQQSPIAAVHVRIAELENGNSNNDPLRQIKLSAYKAFVHSYEKEMQLAIANAIQTASTSACVQMNIDYSKGVFTRALCLSAFAQMQVKTLDEMIRFIEGFN